MSWIRPLGGDQDVAEDAAVGAPSADGIAELVLQMQAADLEPESHARLAGVLASQLRSAGARVRIDRTMSVPVVLAELGGAEGPVYTIQWFGHYTAGLAQTASPGRNGDDAADGRPVIGMRGALAAMVAATAALASRQGVGRSQRLLMTFHGEGARSDDTAREMVRRNWYGDALLSGCTCHLGPGGAPEPRPMADRAYYPVAPGNDLDAAIRWATARLDGREARAVAVGDSTYLTAFVEAGVDAAAMGQVSPDPLSRDDTAGAAPLALLSRLYATTSLRYLQLITK